MTTCTPIYRLPLIEGSDRPCDQSDTWCAFAGALETELDRLDGIIDRTVDTIPMAQVRLTVPRSQPNNPGGGTPQFVPFDTIDVDTADMVDLVTDPFTITLPRFGLYRVHLFVQGATAGAGNEWRVSGRTASGGFKPSTASQTYRVLATVGQSRRSSATLNPAAANCSVIWMAGRRWWNWVAGARNRMGSPL